MRTEEGAREPRRGAALVLALACAGLVAVASSVARERHPLAFLGSYPARRVGEALDARTGSLVALYQVERGHGQDVLRRFEDDGPREGLERVDDRSYRSVRDRVSLSYLWSKEGGVVMAVRPATPWERFVDWRLRHHLP